MSKHAVGFLNGNWKGGNKNDLYLDLTANVKADPKKPCRFCNGKVEEVPILAGICYDCYRESITLVAGYAETDPEWEVKADDLSAAVYQCLAADQAQAHLNEQAIKNNLPKSQMYFHICRKCRTEYEGDLHSDYCPSCTNPRTDEQIADDLFADEVNATRASDYPI